MKSIKEVLTLSTSFLKQHKVERPRFCAELLLSAALSIERIDLYLHFDRPLLEKELAVFRPMLQRAIKKEPIDYIIGQVEFYGCQISISKATLIPRQETEILLDFVCKILNKDAKKALDLCTGSGCLAASLQKAHPHLEVTGVDICKEALEIASKNSDKVRWLQGDLTTPVMGEKFDLVLCNPPYVTEKEYETLSPSVRDFEPKKALVGGPSGLEFYERLAKLLPPILAPGAQVFFEIGTGQGPEIRKIFSNSPFENLHLEKDWAGHDRFFWLNFNESLFIM